jgi:hypothetical protein
MWFYLSILVLLLALYFIRKYIYKLDEFFNKRLNVSNGYIGKPWHLSWSLVLGLLLFITQMLSTEQSESFNSNGLSVFFNNPHPWHWFWLILLLAEIVLFGVVTHQSIHFFGMRFGILRAIIIILLMVLFFWSGMYMGLLFASVAALFIIYKVFQLFYGRKKGLLTSN